MTLFYLSNGDVELGVGSGSFSIFSDGFPVGYGFSVQTPNGAVTVSGRAGFRIDAYPDQQTTIITNFSNFGGVTLNGGGGFSMQLEYGQSVQLAGTNPVLAQPVQPAADDGFAHWSGALESHRFNSISARYVNADLPGYDELDSAGDWQPQSDYGPIWFPHVDAGWAPYHYGHWVNMPYYGWTWVADEPWGAAPFHYGRWVAVGGRWGWIPGPREGHPIWSPAQVVFAGGVQFGGGGVAVWFPLGPGEPYHPWYPCSPTYINQINITNIHESTVIHVQTTYVNITNVTYVNRTVGVTAMNQRDFAAGHPAQTAAVKINPQQMEHIQAAKPEAPPPPQRQIVRPIAKPAAAPVARPVLINNKGQQAAAIPNAKPVAVPVRPAPPAPKSIPGHTPTGTPTVGGKPAPALAPKATPQPAAAAPVKATPPPAPAPKAVAPAPKPAPPVAQPPAARPVQPPARPTTQPAPKTTPPAPKPAKPEAVAPKTTQPPARPETVAPKAPEPKPAVRPQPAPEAKPAPAAKTAPPATKDNRKNNPKKEEKTKPPEKPE